MPAPGRTRTGATVLGGLLISACVVPVAAEGAAVGMIASLDAIIVTATDPVVDPEQSHLPIHDGPGIHPFIPGLTPHVVFFSPTFIMGPDRECQRDRSRSEKRRAPWGLGWLYGYGKDVDIERSVSPFSHYMRTPMLSGLYDRGNGNNCPRPDPEACAVLTLRTPDGPFRLEVALPQAEATTVKELRARMLESLADGETFTLLTREGADHEIRPGTVKEIEARTCKE